MVMNVSLILLVGLAVAFLLYVFGNFWIEGHRSRTAARHYRTDFGRDGRPEVFVVTHPISTSAQGGLSVNRTPAIPRKRASAR